MSLKELGRKIGSKFAGGKQKEQAEMNKKMEEFLTEYRALSAKYQFDFYAQLNIDPNGIHPSIVIGPKRERDGDRVGEDNKA